ncbi:unnamed protein product, partial [marine sediment metagenome]
MHKHKKRTLRLLVGLAILVPLCALAYCAAFLLRFGGTLNQINAALLFSTIGSVLLIKTLALVLARLHQEYARYVSFRDMLVLARTATLSTVGIILVDTMLLTNVTIPRSVVVLDWGVTLALLIVARTVPRLLRENLRTLFRAAPRTRALIVGANDAGEALLRCIRQRSDELSYTPVGFVDDRPEVLGRRIAGIPVLGNYADLAP